MRHQQGPDRYRRYPCPHDEPFAPVQPRLTLGPLEEGSGVRFLFSGQPAAQQQLIAQVYHGRKLGDRLLPAFYLFGRSGRAQPPPQRLLSHLRTQRINQVEEGSVAEYVQVASVRLGRASYRERV